MRHNNRNAVSFRKPSFYNPFAGNNDGTLVAPGDYTVQIDLNRDGSIEEIHTPVSFTIKALNNTVLPSENRSEKTNFQKEIQVLAAEIQAANRMVSEMDDKIKHMREAIRLADSPMAELMTPLLEMEDKLDAIKLLMNGDRLKSRLDMGQPPTPRQRIGSINYEQRNSTSNTTKTHIDSYKIAQEEFIPLQGMIKDIYTIDMIKMEELLKKYNAPYTPGRVLEEEH